jgi:ABC-2 type transport system ATP-binding protein
MESQSKEMSSGVNEPLVRLRGLTKRYGPFTAVNGIDLEVASGQVFGVLGPNGAGKTTTLRMITGMIRPTSGSIHVGPFSLAEEAVEAKQITGFIPDRPYIYDKLTGFEYLGFIAGLYRVSRKEFAARVERLLQLFELSEWGDHLIETYSHGMKQRLVFAGALLPEPRVLIVDEPMVGLDPKGHKLVKRLFRELTEQEGMTILLSTHTLEVAEQVCDEIAIINHGNIVARGTLGELQVESGFADGSLENVFLRLTEEEEEIRDAHVAARFGRATDET